MFTRSRHWTPSCWRLTLVLQNTIILRSHSSFLNAFFPHRFPIQAQYRFLSFGSVTKLTDEDRKSRPSNYVPGSNLVPNTGYPVWGLTWISTSVLANAGTMSSITPVPLPSNSFSVHYSWTIQSLSTNSLVQWQRHYINRHKYNYELRKIC
jgi:hypothetical protein